MPEPKKEQPSLFHIVRIGDSLEITQATEQELADAGLGGNELVGLPSDTLKEAQFKLAHLTSTSKLKKVEPSRFHIVRLGDSLEITQATDQELADAGLGGNDLVGLPSDTLKEAQMKVAYLTAQKRGTQR